LHVNEEIIDELNRNCVKIKSKLIRDWAQSEHPTKQAMLYKLCASNDELIRLQGNTIDSLERDTNKTEYDVRKKLYDE
jgi:hypothetical protein